MNCKRCGHPPSRHVGYSNGCIYVHGTGSFCGCVGWDGVWNAEPPAAASTPPHEQQNEPSSSPARAPGDEPAEPLGWVVVAHDDESPPWFVTGIIPRSRAQDSCDWHNERRIGGYRYTVEPVGGAEREPRTSEGGSNG